MNLNGHKYHRLYADILSEGLMYAYQAHHRKNKDHYNPLNAVRINVLYIYTHHQNNAEFQQSPFVLFILPLFSPFPS